MNTMSHDLERGMIGIQARTNLASCQSCYIFLNGSEHQVDSHFLCRGLNSILNAVLRGRKMSSTGLSTSFPALASFTFGEEAPARTACFAPTLLRAEHSQSQEHNRNSGHARAWRPSMAKNDDASKLLSQRGSEGQTLGRTDLNHVTTLGAFVHLPPPRSICSSQRRQSAVLCCRRRRRKQDSARSGRIGAPAATGPAQSLHPSRRRPRPKQVRGRVPVA